jgi:hypothetical protein
MKYPRWIYITKDNRKMYGFKFEKYDVSGKLEKQWIFVIYYGNKFRAWSNMPIS